MLGVCATCRVPDPCFSSERYQPRMILSNALVNRFYDPLIEAAQIWRLVAAELGAQCVVCVRGCITAQGS